MVEVPEEAVEAEAGVALASVRVEDPEAGSPPRWAGAVARDHHLRSLADDIPAEADPGPARELEPDAGRLRDGARQRATTGRGRRRLEDDEGDPGSAGERCQPPESIGESRSRAAAGRQVDDEQVHRATRQQRAGDGEALLGISRGQHDEPFGLDPARDGLDGIERRRQVQPGDDRAGCLGLRGESQGERRPPARGIAAHRHADTARHATRPEDRVQLGEPRRPDPLRTALRRDDRRTGGLAGERRLGRQGHRRERTDHLAGVAGRGRSPARSECRKGRREVGGGSRHPAQYRTNVRMNQPIDRRFFAMGLPHEHTAAPANTAPANVSVIVPSLTASAHPVSR